MDSNVEQYLEQEKKDVLTKLRKLVVDGQIFLSETKAKDGDTLKVRVESVSKGGGGGSAAAEFEINLRNYGVKAFISPSIFFITRASVNDADLNRTAPGIDANGNPATQKNPIKASARRPVPRHDFRDDRLSPWIETETITSREGGTNPTQHAVTLTRSTSLDKLRSALAPGIGINVTFMNFADPRDFDPSLNQFTTTSGSNFQIGAGAVASLFNSALQFTYGWEFK
jgi:hypothetical protein